MFVLKASPSDADAIENFGSFEGSTGWAENGHGRPAARMHHDRPLDLAEELVVEGLLMGADGLAYLARSSSPVPQTSAMTRAKAALGEMRDRLTARSCWRRLCCS